MHLHYLCVPGMGMILWGESPLYIIRRDVITTFQKVLADGKGDESEGESAQHDEAHLDHCGMVNAAVVQRKIMFLPGEICLPRCRNGHGGTEPAKVRVNKAEVSRRREPGACSGERSEGSVIGGAHEL